MPFTCNYERTFKSMTHTSSADGSIKINPITGRDLLLLFVVLVAATVVRFAHPDAIDYRQDQADLAMLAQDMVEGKGIPLVGIPSSSRLPNSPVTVYALLPAYIISSDPVFVTMYVALLNVIATGLLWMIAHRYFNPTVALVAGLAFALNPWAVGFSRSIWAQDYVPPFLILGVLLGLYGFLEGKRIGQILSLPILLFAVQIHIAAWALMPMYLWLVWVGRKRFSRGAIIATIVLSALVMLPFGLGMLQTFTNNVAPAEGVQVLRRELNVRGLVKPYGQIAWLITGLGTEQYGAREVAEELVQAVFGSLPLVTWLLLGALLPIGVVVLWWRWPRSLSIFTLLWAFLPLLVFSIPILDVFPFYFIGSIAALMILIGLGADWVFDWLRKYQPVRYALIGMLGFVFVTQAIWSLRMIDFVTANYTPGQFGSSTPIKYMNAVRDELQPYRDVVVVSSGEWVDLTASGSRIWAALLREELDCVRDVTLNRNFAVFPAGSFAAVFAPNTPATPAFDPLYREGEPTLIDLRPGEGEYSIYNLQTAPNYPENTIIQPINPVAFANGVSLTGYELRDDLLLLEWSLPGVTKIEYRYRISFTDSAGNMLSEVKSEFWSSVNWCEGDRLLSWNPITLPEGTTTIQIEMGVRGDDAALDVVDSDGRSWAEIPVEPA